MLPAHARLLENTVKWSTLSAQHQCIEATALVGSLGGAASL